MSELVKDTRNQLPVDYQCTIETNLADDAGNVLVYVEIDVQFVLDHETEELEFWAHKYRVSLEGDREETEFECFGRYYENSGPIRTVLLENMVKVWMTEERKTRILERDEFAVKQALFEKERSSEYAMLMRERY